MNETATARVLAFRPRTETERRRDAPPRRHRGPRIRHSRRPPLLRLARTFLLAFAVVGLPLASVLWVVRSPVFALHDLEVSSDGARVSEAWVRRTLEPAHGWNLPRLPLAWVDAALRRHPWVASTALTKELPDRLHVAIVEKREVALERDGDAYWYLDAEGEPIVAYDPADGPTPGAGIDLPLISAASPELDLRPALELGHEIAEVAPRWAAGLSEIEVLGEQDFRVWSAALPFPLLVRSGTLAGKVARLEELLPEIARRYDGVEAVDLRFARRIILQPSVRTAAGGAADGHQRGLGG